MACAPSEDSDQPGHPPSLIRIFAVRMKKAWALSFPLSAQRRRWPDCLISLRCPQLKKAWVLSYPLNAQRRRWSDWADAQADLSLRWAHSHFVGFVTWRLIYSPDVSDKLESKTVCLTTSYIPLPHGFDVVWLSPAGLRLFHSISRLHDQDLQHKTVD